MLLRSLVMFLVILAPTKREQYPEPLQSALSRLSTGTSEFEWELDWRKGPDAGLRERFTTRRAGSDLWESNHGDENGFHARTFRSVPLNSVTDEARDAFAVPQDVVAGTRNKALLGERMWYVPRAEYPLIGNTADESEHQRWRPTNFESIGLIPAWHDETSSNAFRVPSPYLFDFENAKFETRPGERFSVVSATFDSGRSVLSWTFDSRLANSPIRAELLRDGHPLFRSETNYEVIDGRWSPLAVDFYEGTGQDPSKSINVVKATYDQRWHKKEITPEDIGVLPGTQLASTKGLDFWTGADLIDHEEYWPLVYADPELLHPRMAEILAEQTQQSIEEYREFLRSAGENWRRWYKKEHGFDPMADGQSDKGNKENDPWDLYVEKFLAENKLPDAGVTRAKEILKQAKALRDARRKQNAAKIREAKKEGDERKLEKFEEIEKNIFERMLVRNLKKLVPEKKAEVEPTPVP